jgi:hypothetical protein
MKRLIFVLFTVIAFLSVSGCELFRTEVKYSISGPSTSVTIRYNTKSGEIADVVTPSPWEDTGTFYSADKPFLAFMRVTNNGTGAIQAAIYEDDEEAFTPVTINPGAAMDMYAIIE